MQLFCSGRLLGSLTDSYAYDGHNPVKIVYALSDGLNSRSTPKKVDIVSSNNNSNSDNNDYNIIIDWLAFKDYLLKTCKSNRNTAKARICYAKKFYHVLLENDGQVLLTMESQQKRLNVMKSLTLLSKYLGCYDGKSYAAVIREMDSRK
jgi:hypothetical protein